MFRGCGVFAESERHAATPSYSAVIVRERGRSSIPETLEFLPRGLWDTGCSAFAGHDRG